MPNFDGKGPDGKGPLTGRKLGKCGGATPSARGVGRGRGSNAGRGRGLGRQADASSQK